MSKKAQPTQPPHTTGYNVFREALVQMASPSAIFDAPMCPHCEETLPVLFAVGSIVDANGLLVRCDLCGNEIEISDETEWECY